jgi:hypothetical protein
MSRSDQSRMTPALVAVCLGLAAAAVLFAFLARSGGERGEEAIAAAPPVARPTRDAPAPLDAGAVEREELDRVETPVAETPREPGVRCVRRADRAPLAGISLYVDGKVVAGPSGIDGRIAFDRRPAEPFVAWAPGLRPAFVQAGRETPDEIALSAADAALEVAIDNLEPGKEVRRLFVHPYAFSAEPGAPWAPELRLERFGTYRADALPPGAYDVYLWLEDDAGEEASLREERLLLKSGETTTVRLDATKAAGGERDG